MLRDIRATPAYQAAEDLYRSITQPATGQVSDAQDISVAPDGRSAVVSAVMWNTLAGSPPTRICQIDLASGQQRVLTGGPNTDRSPKYSPDGQRIAFLSDRHRAGDFQLYLLDPTSGAAQRTDAVEGWVEYLHWSPDGKQILLGVAGHGADVAGGQGAIASQQISGGMPTWMPSVDSGDESHRWRRVWIYDLASNQVRQVGKADVNVWEAAWCGSDAIAAVVSPGSGEGLWYSARLSLIDARSGGGRELYAPLDQLGLPAALPSGETLAIVEAVCSDRWIVAGDLRLLDIASGSIERIDTRGVDITYTEWRSDQRLLVAGHRGFETVVGLFDVASGTFREVWSSTDISTGGRYISVSGHGDAGDFVLVGEGFKRAPEVAEVTAGKYRTVKSFDLGYGEAAEAIHSVERIAWKAPDGLEIQGWLLRPAGAGPHPMVMNIHGGPVWCWHPFALTRPRYVPFCLLLNHGYAVFLPNPRGSSGRGQDFARKVMGDMGGADTLDYLSGIDHLVKQGSVDPQRLGVTGVSYGGFMTAWLITQDRRFAAAAPISPVTNQVTEHLLSNIPHFTAAFLDDHYSNAGGKYYDRSPIMHAREAKTPSLNICGALDRCTPPEEAVQFHNALLENGVKSVLLTYPEEGHGIHHLPAGVDFAARMLMWFEEHLGVARKG